MISFQKETFKVNDVSCYVGYDVCEGAVGGVVLDVFSREVTLEFVHFVKLLALASS